jgi:hypothetical protein
MAWILRPGMRREQWDVGIATTTRALRLGSATKRHLLQGVLGDGGVISGMGASYSTPFSSSSLLGTSQATARWTSTPMRSAVWTLVQF